MALFELKKFYIIKTVVLLSSTENSQACCQSFLQLMLFHYITIKKLREIFVRFEMYDVPGHFTLLLITFKLTVNENEKDFSRLADQCKSFA
jgi:hypothetical protein